MQRLRSGVSEKTVDSTVQPLSQFVARLYAFKKSDEESYQKSLEWNSGDVSSTVPIVLPTSTSSRIFTVVEEHRCYS